MDQFTAVATARAESLQRKIEQQLNQASIRYVFAPLFDMIVESLSTTIVKGAIVPISEQGQPVGEVYLQTLVREGETFDPSLYDMRNGIGEITINPAPLVDSLISRYGPQGAIQVKNLFNMDVSEFLNYTLNRTIFGDQEYETAEAYLERFKAIRVEQRNATIAPLINRVLSELEASVSLAFTWAKAKAEWANQALKAGDIKHFSVFENRLFKFTGVTPIDEAMNQVATNQAALATTLPQVVTDFKDAVLASKPDYGELGAAIAAGFKEGVREILANQNQSTQSAKEESKQGNNKGGNKSS
jgi:hypothetical protein